MNKFQKAIHKLSKISYKAIKRNSNTDKEYDFKKHYRITKLIYGSKDYSDLKLIKEAHEWYRKQIK